MADGLSHLELPRMVPLADEETRALLRRARAGDRDAREVLVQANLRLVMSVARRFRGRGMEGDDLFQIGCVGLVKAIDGFDPAYGVRFSTYAVPVIMGEIRRHLRAHGLVKVSRSLQDLARRVEICRSRLEQRMGRSPTLGEVAAALGVEREEVVQATEAARGPASLEEPASGRAAELLPTGDRLRAAAGYGDQEMLLEGLALRSALASLEPWERRLILLRFFRERSQTEVARRLGVSQAHVSRAERRILRALRARMD